MSEIKILKLMDGSTIVGKITISGDVVEIEHPIELISNVQPLQGAIGEQINLRPWIAIAQEDIFTIERYNVITMSGLQEQFISGYERMVEQIYYKESLWAGDLVENDLDSELDMDTMTELADAIIKKQIH
jgi:hypothetical protein